MGVKYINDGVDLKALSELHKKNSPQDRTPEVLDWQYNTHKDLGSTIFVALDDSKGVVGSQGAIYYKLLAAGTVVNSFKSEATLIDADSRKNVDFITLFQTCIDHVEKHKCDIYWGVSSIAKFVKVFGMVNLGNLYTTGIIPLKSQGMFDLFQMTDRVDGKMSPLLRLLSFFHFTIFYPLFKLTLFNKKIPAKIEILPELKESDDVVNLHLKLNSLYKDQIFIYQDAETIKWRIDGNPVRKIHKFFLYEGDELRGYCYLQENKKHLEILEMAYLDQSLLKPLLNLLVRNHKKDFSSIIIMLNGENEIAKEMIGKMKRTGFWFIKNKAAFPVKIMNKSLKELQKNPNKWFLSGIWREGV